MFLAFAQLGFGAETGNSAALNRAIALNAQGSDFFRENRQAEAEAAYRAAIRECEPADEVGNCPELPISLSNLGALYFQTGRLGEAELPLVRAIRYWSKESKPAKELSNALYNLAAVYRNQARYAEAAPLYERALAVTEELEGPMEVSIAPLLNGMALLCIDTAEYTRAHQLLDRAVSIVELQNAENTLEAATSFAALGAVLEAQADARQAEKWFTRALKIREHLLGQNDTIVADTRLGLALVYHRENRLPEAADLNVDAIATYQERHEAKNLPVALNNLGRIRAEQGRLKEAEIMFRKAIELWEQQLGPRHPNTAAGLTSLGLLLSSRRKFSEAEPILRRARDIDQEHFPVNHPRIANDLSNMADLALNRKHYAEAEALLGQEKAMLENQLSPNYPDIGMMLARLAHVYHREARLDESEIVYTRALQLLEQAWGVENPLLLSPLEDYSAVLRSKKNYADAASIDARTMKIRVKQALQRSKDSTVR